jgi:hypothetical protein
MLGRLSWAKTDPATPTAKQLAIAKIMANNRMIRIARFSIVDRPSVGKPS